jgi:alkylation response protein AidB-like acyl-CoA dehydrogenase
VIPHAKAAGKTDDPRIRQRIAYIQSLVHIEKWTQQRARAARAAGNPGPEGSIGKLLTSRIAQACAEAHGAIGGAQVMLGDGEGPMDGIVSEITLSYPAQSIAGGTDEIQLNILAERVLGLPKEPQVDSEVAFREVRKNR